MLCRAKLLNPKPCFLKLPLQIGTHDPRAESGSLSGGFESFGVMVQGLGCRFQGFCILGFGLRVEALSFLASGFTGLEPGVQD